MCGPAWGLGALRSFSRWTLGFAAGRPLTPHIEVHFSKPDIDQLLENELCMILSSLTSSPEIHWTSFSKGPEYKEKLNDCGGVVKPTPHKGMKF